MGLDDQEIVVWFSSRGSVIFLFSKTVRSLLGSAQPRNHGVPEALSSELKRSEREANRFTSDVRANNTWSHTSTCHINLEHGALLRTGATSLSALFQDFLPPLNRHKKESVQA
jgi:hypothetical protein